MACTMQKVRPSPQQLKEMSFVHTKRILAIAVSSIAYIRHLFPDESFSEMDLDGMKVKIMNRDSPARQLVDWMTGVYDALSKEYLKKLRFTITYKSAETGKDIAETYIFAFSYSGKEVSTDMQLVKGGCPSSKTLITSEDTKKSAQKFLRNLFQLVSSFESIQTSFMATMHLMYYDKNRPTEYHPPGFEAADPDEFVTTGEIQRYNIGKSESSHHTTSLIIRVMPVKDCGKDATTGKSQGDNLIFGNNSRESLPPANNAVNSATQNKSAVSRCNSQETQDLVRCPCGFNENDGAMVMCTSCTFWQHAICFCLCPETAPDNHICNLCGDPSKPDLYPTDVTLLDLNEKQLMEACTWRRALRVCFEVTSITVTSLRGRLSCSSTLARKIINRLVEERIAKPVKGHKSTKDIDRVSLEKTFYRDVQKPSADMRQQATEAKDKFSNVASQHSVFHSNLDDETPMKSESALGKGTRTVKRKLDVSSQDADFRVPAAPTKEKRSRFML